MVLGAYAWLRSSPSPLGFCLVLPYKHVGDLSDLTLRFLIGVIKLLTKRLAIGIFLGPGVHSYQLLGIRVADGNNFAVTVVGTKHIQIAVQESARSPLLMRSSAFALSVFRAATAFCSIALASSAVPWSCCAKALPKV